MENKYFLNENDIDSTINNKFNDLKVEEFNTSDDIIEKTEENIFIDSEITDGIISEIDFLQKVDSNKTQNIKRLLKEGLTEEQICHELSVSKGEVLLVKGLFKK